MTAPLLCLHHGDYSSSVTEGVSDSIGGDYVLYTWCVYFVFLKVFRIYKLSFR